MKKMPLGAEIVKEGVHFRVWAPKCKKVEVFLDNGSLYPLMPEKEGFFSGIVKEAKGGTLYQFKLDDGNLFPDPASRCQPLGPHGPSKVMDPNKFRWSDSDWEGIVEKDKVILYELHIGTFTPEGTWLAAIEKLHHLKELGINVIEMMPVAEWPGRFNWGYDGVNLFAPTNNYGHPDDLKSFIDEAHKLEIGVILDVVYNHFGPDGNYLSQFSDFYFKKDHTEWGQAINFDEEGSGPVREFFIQNAGYWIEEFHFDGLRLDACHSIYDKSTPHILLQVTQAVREKGRKRKTYVIAENEKEEAHLVFPEKEGGYGMDAVWNEDFHHTSFVRLRGRSEAYFSDYRGKAQEFVSTLKHNFLFQGQWYNWQQHERGSPSLNVEAHHFVNFLENHDQVANTGNAARLMFLSHPRIYRAMTALFLLAPQIPLFFQGQEFGSSSHFYYFCDHNADLGEKINAGRLGFMSQFGSMNHPEVKSTIPLPNEESTFLKSKLNWNEKKAHAFIFQFHKELIEMRKKDSVFGNMKEVKLEGAVLNEDAFLLRYFSRQGERLLIINLGQDSLWDPAPEPLLAPPKGHKWKLTWTSEDPRYGGFGYRPIPEKGNWTLTSYTALLFHSELAQTKRDA